MLSASHLRLYLSSFSLVMLRHVFFDVMTSSTMASRLEFEEALCMEPLLEPSVSRVNGLMLWPHVTSLCVWVSWGSLKCLERCLLRLCSFLSTIIHGLCVDSHPFQQFLTLVIFLVAYCLVLGPVFEEGLAPWVEDHGELLHLLTVDLDFQFLVVTPNNPDLTKPDRASKMYCIENTEAQVQISIQRENRTQNQIMLHLGIWLPDMKRSWSECSVLLFHNDDVHGACQGRGVDLLDVVHEASEEVHDEPAVVKSKGRFCLISYVECTLLFVLNPTCFDCQCLFLSFVTLPNVGLSRLSLPCWSIV